MLTKTFKADTMISAFEDIQKDLGSEAIIVSVRKVPGGRAWEIWKKPYVEVVAMGRPSNGKSEDTPAAVAKLPQVSQIDQLVKTAQPAIPPTKPVQNPKVTSSPVEKDKKASAEIKTQPKDAIIAELISNSGSSSSADSIQASIQLSKSAEFDKFPPLARTRMLLLSQGVDEKIVQKLLQTCAESLNPSHLNDMDRIRNYIQRQMEAELRIQTPASTLSNKVMCLVGTSGAGKTSSCAKLATFFSKVMGKKVAWVCADTIRAGAIHEARTYTEAINVPLHLAYTPLELVDAINLEKDKDMVLVDLPGCNPRMEDRVVEIGTFITAIKQRATYVVAPATTKEADLADLLAAFSPFKLNGLIFTKMDETRAFGSLYNIASKSQLPLTFFTNGSRIMDDLYPGQEKDLVNAIFQEGFLK